VKGLGNCHFWDHLPVKIYDRSWKVQNVANLLELFFQLPLAHDLDHLRALIIAITPNGHLVGPSSGGTLETAVNLVLIRFAACIANFDDPVVYIQATGRNSVVLYRFQSFDRKLSHEEEQPISGSHQIMLWRLPKPYNNLHLRYN
jgi:hypothetical protein